MRKSEKAKKRKCGTMLSLRSLFSNSIRKTCFPGSKTETLIIRSLLSVFNTSIRGTTWKGWHTKSYTLQTFGWERKISFANKLEAETVFMERFFKWMVEEVLTTEVLVKSSSSNWSIKSWLIIPWYRFEGNALFLAIYLFLSQHKNHRNNVCTNKDLASQIGPVFCSHARS